MRFSSFFSIHAQCLRNISLSIFFATETLKLSVLIVDFLLFRFLFGQSFFHAMYFALHSTDPFGHLFLNPFHFFSCNFSVLFLFSIPSLLTLFTCLFLRIASICFSTFFFALLRKFFCVILSYPSYSCFSCLFFLCADFLLPLIASLFPISCLFPLIP